jgi:hypothetical protein
MLQSFKEKRLPSRQTIEARPGQSRSPWQTECYHKARSPLSRRRASCFHCTTPVRRNYRICSPPDGLEPSTDMPAYPLKAREELVFSHISAVVRASRPPISPVVPKAKGNQRGMPRRVGLA